jgi:hypothetical protein
MRKMRRFIAAAATITQTQPMAERTPVCQTGPIS